MYATLFGATQVWKKYVRFFFFLPQSRIIQSSHDYFNLTSHTSCCIYYTWEGGSLKLDLFQKEAQNVVILSSKTTCFKERYGLSKDLHCISGIFWLEHVREILLRHKEVASPMK